MLTLVAVVALDTAPVARLRALLTHVADAIAVPTDHHALVGALGLGMACLPTVEAGSTTAATSLARVRTISLVVARVKVSEVPYKSPLDILTQPRHS